MTPKEKLQRWITENAEGVNIWKINAWFRKIESLPGTIMWDAQHQITTTTANDKNIYKIQIKIWFGHDILEPKLTLQS